MYWRLTDSLTACIAAGRVVFLDVARDRYRALPPAANAAVRCWLEEPDGGAAPVALAERLAALDIISPRDRQALRATPIDIAMPSPFDAEPLPAPRHLLASLPAVGRAVIGAWQDVRARPLGAVLAARFRPGQRPGDSPEPGPAPRAARLAAFRAARPLVPVPRVCLHDCLALMDFLGRSRGKAQLVFGITAFPFGAHCWVQAGGLVLDDHPESPSRFQPILALP